MTGGQAPEWVRHPLVRALRGVLPAPVRAALWRTASAGKRLRRRVAARAPRPLRRAAPEHVWVRPGRYLPPDQAPHLPVTMLVVLGADADQLERTVANVAWHQTLQLSFIPLFVTDVGDSRPFRRHGYLYEYIPSFTDWATFNDPELWPGFVEERLDELVATYRPASVSTLDLDSTVGGASLGLAPYRGPTPGTELRRLRSLAAGRLGGPVGRARKEVGRRLGRYDLR